MEPGVEDSGEVRAGRGPPTRTSASTTASVSAPTTAAVIDIDTKDIATAPTAATALIRVTIQRVENERPMIDA